MKRHLPIPILLVTLLWVSVPHLAADNTNLQHESRLTALSDESSHLILSSLSATSDTRIDLPVATFLPEDAESGFTFHRRTEHAPRDFSSFIISHHLYTQITSSYL